MLGKIGGFGGLFRADFNGMKDPVLVSSVDGVGTKLKVALAVGRHDTIGQDLVNHCINDIAVLGARPLFSRLHRRRQAGNHVFRQLLSGLAKACKAAALSSAGRPPRCPECIETANMTSPARLSGWWTVQRCSMVRAFDRATL